jgi:predicted permease
MATWFRRLVYMMRQSRHDADLREEIETHRAMRVADLERDGMTREEAVAASRRALGNTLLAREDVRDLWSGSWATWWQDVRYGARTFRRNPGFIVIAVVTLALGIGVNTGVFTVVNAILLRPLTAPRAHELVSISQAVTGVPELAGLSAFSTADYMAYRGRTQTLSGLVAFGNARGEATLGGDAPRRLLGALVSCNFFAVLQQPPTLGRGFGPGDCEPDADLVVVLTRELWRTAFGSDPHVVGRSVQLNRQRATVIGVAAGGTFNGSIVGGGYLAPLPAGRLLSSGDSRYSDDRMAWLTLLGRRNDSVAIEEVRAELAVIAAQIDLQRPGRSTVLAVDRARSTDGLSPELRTWTAGAATVLMAVFGCILLIACANVANLLLARGASRTQEIGVRVSLGASRGRVVRQLVTESLLLSVAGGVLGSLAAVWSFESLVTMAVPALLPPWFPLTVSVDLSPDVQVLAFATALTIVTGMLFGLAPALHASRPDLHAVMRQDSTGGGRRAGGGRLRATLVGVQVALCMVLMIAAGLLLRGLYSTYTVDPGFSYRDVALVSLESVFDGYSAVEAEARQRSLLAAVRAVPGVTAVGGADHKPLGDDRSPRLIRLPNERENVVRLGEATTVSQDYFAVLGLRIVRGRGFTEQDEAGRGPGPRPAILTAATTGNLWPDGDAIGRTLVAVPPGLPDAVETLQVVGIVADAQMSAIGRVDPYHLYLPGQAGGVLLVKGRADVAATVVGIRAAARAVDPTLMLTILPLEATLGWSRGISGTVTTLFGALGVLALILAGIGVYGVVAFAVSGRYTEIAIRLALGASVPGLLVMLLRDTLRPVVIGAAVGIAGAAGLSRALSSVLFGISPADPLGLGGAALLVLAVAFVAALIGARPAARADAIAALRVAPLFRG